MKPDVEFAKPAGTDEHRSTPGVLSRREASRRFLGMAAILQLDTLHPVWNHVRQQPSAEDLGEIKSKSSKPNVLTMDQMMDFVGVSEGIVPGSTKALVGNFVDLLLSVDSPEVQQGFIRSLAVLQEEAKRRFGATLAGLAPSQRDEILAGVSTANEGSPQRAAFTDLKTWVVGAYYSSEIGMSELGWTPGRFFDSLPELNQSACLP